VFWSLSLQTAHAVNLLTRFRFCLIVTLLVNLDCHLLPRDPAVALIYFD
jgi:hypothetical protein